MICPLAAKYFLILQVHSADVGLLLNYPAHSLRLPKANPHLVLKSLFKSSFKFTRHKIN